MSVRTDARGRGHVVGIAVAMLVAALLAGSGSPPRVRADPRAWTFPLRLHVPEHIASASIDRWIDASVDEANRAFAVTGVRFERRPGPPLARSLSQVLSDRTFDALRAYVDATQIDVFVATDVWRPRAGGAPRPVAGVTRQPDSHPSDGFVLIATRADTQTLTHELGHYFGLEHSRLFGNIMWPSEDRGLHWRPGPIALESLQRACIVQHARRFAAEGRPAAIAVE